jgi:hypothetical protein
MSIDTGRSGGPRSSLVTTLPRSVWQEHLRPLLSVKEAAGLRGVCKALKGLVSGWPVRLGGSPIHLRGLTPEDLEAALTCFPAAEGLSIFIDDMEEPLSPAEESRLVEVLRRHGGTLKRVGGARRLLLSAVQAGALPKLTYFDFSTHNHLRHAAAPRGGGGDGDERQS